MVQCNLSTNWAWGQVYSLEDHKGFQQPESHEEMERMDLMHPVYQGLKEKSGPGTGTGHHKEWKGRWNSQPERRDQESVPWVTKDQDQKIYEQGPRRELGASFSPLQLIFVGDSAHAWSCSNLHDLVTCIHCFLDNLSVSVLVDENIQMFGNLDCKLLWSKVTLFLFWIHLLPVPFRAGKRAYHRRHLTCTEPSRSLIGVESVSQSFRTLKQSGVHGFTFIYVTSSLTTHFFSPWLFLALIQDESWRSVELFLLNYTWITWLLFNF